MARRGCALAVVRVCRVLLGRRVVLEVFLLAMTRGGLGVYSPGGVCEFRSDMGWCVRCMDSKSDLTVFGWVVSCLDGCHVFHLHVFACGCSDM